MTQQLGALAAFAVGQPIGAREPPARFGAHRLPGEAPPLLRIALGDMYTGANAVGAICAALLGRVKSGRGQHIDLALYDCLVSMHEYAIQCYTLSGGKDNEATLLPLPLQGNRGINVAIGVTALELTLVEPGRRR